MERILVKLEQRLHDLKEQFWQRPTFEPIEIAKKAGAISELEHAIALVKEERKAHDEDD